MRIALVNDVVTALEAMRRVIISTREHRIAWIAQDGAEALELCARDTPDLILMDLIMPRMDGVEATRRIMARTPCAIVVVTANVSRPLRRRSSKRWALARWMPSTRRSSNVPANAVAPEHCWQRSKRSAG